MGSLNLVYSHLGDKPTGRQILDDWATPVGSSGRQDINFLNATLAESNAINVRQTPAVDTANRSSFTFWGTNYTSGVFRGGGLVRGPPPLAGPP